MQKQKNFIGQVQTGNRDDSTTGTCGSTSLDVAWGFANNFTPTAYRGDADAVEEQIGVENQVFLCLLKFMTVRLRRFSPPVAPGVALAATAMPVAENRENRATPRYSEGYTGGQSGAHTSRFWHESCAVGFHKGFKPMVGWPHGHSVLARLPARCGMARHTHGTLVFAGFRAR